MTKFWECEEGGSSSNYSVEETKCEEHYARTVKRGEDGRYSVGMPKSSEMLSKLGESKNAADRRLLLLERRLARDKNLKGEYHAFMRDYMERGHMRKITEDPESTATTFYLPHHPVIRSSSTTTRVRVVFDASSKTSTGISLNEALLNGPVIQDDQRTIISRSRLFPILLVADVEKMFRQIRMDPGDLPLQRIRWRFSEDEPIDTYELLTVTYGTKPAPFLATRTLKQLSEDDVAKYPLAATRVARDVYMDDVITGAANPAEAKLIREQLDNMLLGAGFPLRKWVSNCDEALEGVSEDNLALPREKGVDFDEERTVKTLGLVWEPKTDTFRFKIESAPIPRNELTKAKILSIIAKLFDPLGLVGPVVAKAKIFMQRIWELKNSKGKPWDWNDPLPQSMLDEWIAFYDQLPYLNNLRIPRFAMISNPVKIQLHFFSDASEKALGACLFIRSEDNKGRVKVSLFSSKSRVAPLKRQQIPRLELNGSWVSADMYLKFRQCIDFPFETFFWTDSTTVLQWLAKPPSTWNTYVANRVSFIQHATQNCHWNHCPGKLNPADQLSRGLDPKEILENGVWLDFPTWIYDVALWPRHRVSQEETEECLKERRKNVESTAAASIKPFNDVYFANFNDYWKLIRTTAYWKRFFRNCRLPKADRRQFTPLTIRELRDAEICLVRLVQKEAFETELRVLAEGKPVPPSSKLRWFDPKLAPDGIIRVGGRLDNSEKSEQSKHPVIIPGNHYFSKLLAGSYHKWLLHAGTQLMLSTMRQRFWPLGGRNLCRRVAQQCQRCYRAKPQLLNQFMGQLPTPRTIAARPFTTTGVDYFGPVYIRQGYRRGPVKAYVAVFVCFCTKAVHLELVSDLSTVKFVQALRRFVARRGKPSDIYSDNGTNFVGARNDMADLLKTLQNPKHHEEIQQECSKNGIDWHFIPPGAPHFGGLWEAAVRSAKKHLLRVIGNSSILHEDYLTLLAQVEACLNSRPLTQLSDDPTDLQPLTPAHFLIGSSLQQIPDKDYSNVPANRLTHWQAIQQQLQHFWRRWHTEYLQQLQARVKNWKPAIVIEPGRLVIVVDENQPSMKWKMARIHQVHPGADGVVRVVTLRTSSGYMRRPVSKICLLPTPVEDVDPEKADSSEI